MGHTMKRDDGRTSEGCLPNLYYNKIMVVLFQRKSGVYILPLRFINLVHLSQWSSENTFRCSS